MSSLRDAGFEPLESSLFAPEFDAFSFVQSTLNRLGLRQNALYDVLRGRAAKLGRAAERPPPRRSRWPRHSASSPCPRRSSRAWPGAGSTLTVLARRG